MRKVLLSIPDELDERMRATFPPRQRSRIIARLIEKEVAKREKALYNAAAAVEKDDALREEMEAWDITVEDGLNDEPR